MTDQDPPIDELAARLQAADQALLSSTRAGADSPDLLALCRADAARTVPVAVDMEHQLRSFGEGTGRDSRGERPRFTRPRGAGKR